MVIKYCFITMIFMTNCDICLVVNLTKGFNKKKKKIQSSDANHFQKDSQ